MSREPWEWTEDDILAIVRENKTETLSLEFKAAGSLGKTDGKRAEISKDVSAMANSAGGTIIYGIDEQKARRGPLKLDAINPTEFTTEWIEQVIDSNIQRRIPDLRVISIPMVSSPLGYVVYVVSVPQSNRAPHMAADHRYYKRLEKTTAMMEEYEVRDVGRRLESPDLDICFTIGTSSTSADPIAFPEIYNVGPEPAFYVTCKLYVLKSHLTSHRIHSFSLDWSQKDSVQLLSETT